MTLGGGLSKKTTFEEITIGAQDEESDTDGACTGEFSDSRGIVPVFSN